MQILIINVNYKQFLSLKLLQLLQEMTESVKVMLRCRPMSQKQKEKGHQNLITVNRNTQQIALKKLGLNPTYKYFTYDHVFDQNSTQREVYQQSAFSLVQNVLQGYNGTIFAYGQTGCGKTHTMLGVSTTSTTKKSVQPLVSKQKQNLVTITSFKLEQDMMGIIPRAFHQIMTITNSQKNKTHLIQCTFIQIYNQEIHDLLGKDIKAKLNLQQTPEGLLMKQLSVHIAKTVADMEKFMEIGYRNRVIRQTNMNKESSRSHCIFSIRIQQSQTDEHGAQKFKVGKLNLVDLAGSQRQSKTNIKDDGVKEAAKINLSLSALGNVISSLVDGKNQHIPYRDSKLTRILQDSLGGNTKTVMIATISPSEYNYQQTLSTLRYSTRAKFIQNKPIINQDPKDALLRKYQQEIKRLKMILQGKLPYVRGNQSFYIPKEDDDTMNIFSRFPELKNEQNQQKLHQIQQKLQQIEQLSNLNGQTDQNNLNKDTQNLNQEEKFLHQQLQTTKKFLNLQKQQKQTLKKQLQFFQSLIAKQATPQNTQQLTKIAQLKQKLRQQKQKEQQYKLQQQKREQQLLNIQKNYKNLNEEVDNIRVKYQEIRLKYVQTVQELKDCRQAHQKQKEDILDALRIQQAENNKLTQILKVLISTQNLDKIYDKCKWIDQTKQWVVPKFNYSQRLGVNFGRIVQQKDKMPLQVPHQASKTYKNKLQKEVFDRESQKNKLNQAILQQVQKQKGARFDRRSLSQRDKKTSLKNMNLFKVQQQQLVQRNSNFTSRFKKSNYSLSSVGKQQIRRQLIAQQKKQKQDTSSLLVPIQQKVATNKYSLKDIASSRREINNNNNRKISLDMDQIKRQILNQLKMGKRNSKPI